MPNEWDIKSRAERCAVTGHEFAEGEHFYTLLFRDRHGFRREDLSEEAWTQLRERGEKEQQPFSFWRSKFEPPPPPAPEPLAKQTAEDLLRRYMAEDNAHHANARYILALMLERKRLLKQIAAKDDDNGRTLIYEHVKTGEVFVVPDPQLRLDQIEAVQNEVAALLR
jgi:hypothetical protein